MGCIGAGCLRGSQAHSPDRLCWMSLSVSLYGGGVYGVYWGGVFTGLSGPQPRLTVGCRACLPVWGRGVWGVLERGVYGALRPTAQTDYRMSLSTTLYGGGVYRVY